MPDIQNTINVPKVARAIGNNDLGNGTRLIKL